MGLVGEISSQAEKKLSAGEPGAQAAPPLLGLEESHDSTQKILRDQSRPVPVYHVSIYVVHLGQVHSFLYSAVAICHLKKKKIQHIFFFFLKKSLFVF